MDKRKKRTSYQQYTIYIKLLEEDQVFRTGVLTRDVDSKYLHRKWDELAEQLNSCGIGPVLSAGEWKKRLTDWKNTTRAKYRKTVSDSEKGLKPSLTPLEQRALNLWGPISAKQHPGSTQVESCDGQDMDLKSDKIQVLELSLEEELHKAVAEGVKDMYSSDDQVVANGDMGDNMSSHSEAESSHHVKSSVDIKNLTAELKRLADIQEERLKFEIAKFKYRNPGFQFEYHVQTGIHNDEAM